MKSLYTLIMALVLTACAVPVARGSSLDTLPEPTATIILAAPVPVESDQPEQPAVEHQVNASAVPTITETPRVSQRLPLPTPTATKDASLVTANAPLNPLTGLPCEEPELLGLPPALVSVSNFPVTARPQGGLSYAPYVFELYIGEGMTRFLALFYCTFPPETVSGDNTIGPIRSGRLPYESLRTLYNGFLIMASASGEVTTRLGNSANIFGSDASNINSALVEVSQLKSIAENQAGSGPPNLSGNQFDALPPQDGQDAGKLWVFYNFYNQVLWTYDAERGAYLRAQDKADGSGAFLQSTDRLTGEPLAFENVIVFAADHEVLNSEGTLIDVNLLYTLGKAYLFRDGQMFPIRWTTMNEAYEKETGKLRPVRFVDAQGNPVALKPGRTWVEFVHLTTTFSEQEPGFWKARFYAP